MIFSLNSQLFYAEDFVVDDSIVNERTYSNITLKSANDVIIHIKRTFKYHEVLHLKLDNRKIVDMVDSYYAEIGKLIDLSRRSYIRRNIKKWLLRVPANNPSIKDKETAEPITYDKYKERVLDGLLSDEDGIVMLAKGFELEGLESNNFSQENYTAFSKNFEEQVADAFLIPREIYFGNRTAKSGSESDFFTYAIKPYLKLLENALNSVVINKVSYLKGCKIKANMNSIKVYNVLDNATAMDKLYSNGFSHNDLLELADLEQVDEDWANEHRITKNYSDDVSSKSSEKGGDEDDE